MAAFPTRGVEFGEKCGHLLGVELSAPKRFGFDGLNEVFYTSGIISPSRKGLAKWLPIRGQGIEQDRDLEVVRDVETKGSNAVENLIEAK